jgi:DNA-binding transcriptional LysR family regulator
MNLEWLRTYQRVVEARSFTRAAEALYLTQPAVSQQVRQLERFFRAKLLRQVGRELQLTEPGYSVYELANRVVLDVDRIRRNLEQLTHQRQEVVTIASGPTPLCHYFPRLLKRFWAAYPEISVRTMTRRPEGITQAVVEGEADIGFNTTPYLNPHLAATPCVDDRVIAVCAPEHPLVGRCCLHPDALRSAKVALLPAVAESQQLVVEWFAANGVVFENSVQLSSMDEIRAAALANLAVGFLSEYTVIEELAAGRLVRLTIEGFHISRPIFAIHEKQPGPAAAAMIELMIEARNDPRFWLAGLATSTPAYSVITTT